VLTRVLRVFANHCHHVNWKCRYEVLHFLWPVLLILHERLSQHYVVLLQLRSWGHKCGVKLESVGAQIWKTVLYDVI
jgi:hypothetical protein